MEISHQMDTVIQSHKSSLFSEPENTNVPDQEAQQTRWSWLSHRHYLHEMLEAALVLGIVSVGGLFLPSTWFQSHLIFFVFFLIVLFIAIRSHAVTAYTVGFLVAGCYGLLLWQQSHANPSFALLQLFIEPFVLFVSGIVINEMLRTRRHQLEVAGQQHVQKEALLEEMKERYQATEALNTEFKRQLVGQAVVLSTVSEKMTRLWRLQGQEQYNAILDIVMYALNAKFCALYLLRNGRMSLCANKAEKISNYSKTLSLSLDVKDVLVSRTIQSRRICTIRDTLADSRSSQRVVAVMIGPLVDHRDQVVGVIIVDDLPLLKFLPTTVRLFGSLLHMISIAVRPVADEGPAISLPLWSDTEVKTVQKPRADTNRDARAVKSVIPTAKL